MMTMGFAASYAWLGVSHVVPFLAVLGSVVCVHELGHFLVGRWCGATVDAFSLGMGPELLGFTDRLGTRWRVSAIPIGGYVRFAGDRNAASAPTHGTAAETNDAERKVTLAGQPLFKRAAIVAAGPIANILLAILAFAALAYAFGETIVPPRVDSVVPGSPAEHIGFRSGDVVKSIDGRTITTFPEIANFVSVRPGESMTFVVERDDGEVTLVATPVLTTVESGIGAQRVGRLGIVASQDAKGLQVVRFGPIGALEAGFERCWTTARMSGEYIWRLIAGRATTDQLSGPVRIAQMSSAAASMGWVALINLAAILSLSLGVMNLMPVPMLDGGHLLFYAIEAGRGRALSARAQEFGLRAGLACLLTFMVFVTINDLRRLFST